MQKSNGLRIKIFSGYSPQDIEASVDAFRIAHKVRFGQSSVGYDGRKAVFMITLYYEDTAPTKPNLDLDKLKKTKEILWNQIKAAEANNGKLDFEMVKTMIDVYLGHFIREEEKLRK